jgi:hypothetical protein
VWQVEAMANALIKNRKFEKVAQGMAPDAKKRLTLGKALADPEVTFDITSINSAKSCSTHENQSPLTRRGFMKIRKYSSRSIKA